MERGRKPWFLRPHRVSAPRASAPVTTSCHRPPRGDSADYSRIERVAATEFTVSSKGEWVGKELVARQIHESRRASRSLRRGELRRDCRDPARGRVVRDRGSDGDRGARSHGQVRARPRRDAVSRRGRRSVLGGAGQASARDPGHVGRAGRRLWRPWRRHPDHRGHQPEPGGAGRRRAVSAGSLLSAPRRRDGGSAASRADGDIVELAELFLERHRDVRTLRLSEAAVDALLAYHWPGNVRELRARDRAGGGAGGFGSPRRSTIYRRRCSTGTTMCCCRPSAAGTPCGRGQAAMREWSSNAVTTTSGRRAGSWASPMTHTGQEGRGRERNVIERTTRGFVSGGAYRKQIEPEGATFRATPLQQPSRERRRQNIAAFRMVAGRATVNTDSAVRGCG